MDAERGGSLRGRDNAVDLVWTACLDRKRDAPDAPSILAVVGPRGSGKTELLKALEAKCRVRAAQPFVPVLDLERFGAARHGWQVAGQLAYELSSARGVQLERLKFPRFALGRMIVEAEVTTASPEGTQSDIEDLLRRAVRLDQTAQTVSTLLGQLPQLLGVPPWVGVAGAVGAWAIRGRPIVRLLFRTGMEFYRQALGRAPDTGFPALVQLGKLGQAADAGGQATVDRVLCEAFLADLAESYEHGYRPRTALVLVDNVQTAVGQAFLTALTEARSRRARQPNPLVAIVTSRAIDFLAPLLAPRDERPDSLSTWLEMPLDTEASVEDWRTRSSTSGSRVYAIRLSDLSREDVEEIETARFPDDSDDSSGRLTPLVHSLTRGHPWGVVKVFEALDARRARRGGLTESEQRNVLETRCPSDAAALGDVAADYLLLGDLPAMRRADAITWSAAADVVAAEEALPVTAGLQASVAELCWLESRNRAGGDGRGPTPTLHPWLRRTLVRRLALRGVTGTAWSAVYGTLHEHGECTAIDRRYYEVAVERFLDAVAYLNDRFDELDADSWIAEFNEVTSAPRRLGGRSDAPTTYADLVEPLMADVPDARNLPTADPHGDRWKTIAQMAVARSIWSDPLSDPTLEMNEIIRTGYGNLRKPKGQLRLVAEGQFYSRGGRP